MTSHQRFPLIDLSTPAEASLFQGLDAACTDLGFFFLVGHRVPAAQIDTAYTESLAFFDLPPAAKLVVARPAEGISRGYNRLADQSHAATFGELGDAGRAAPPDLQESFAIGRLDGRDNLWPADRPNFAAALSAYFTAMSDLAARLMALFARALALPADFFADKIDRHASILRMVHYPEQPTAPAPGQLRAGPHTDFGTLTILRTDDAPGGLQVRDATGGWLDVQAPRGSFVVNIGDLMRRWTNDRWASSIHRVVNPPRQHATSRRLSIVFFHEPNPDAVVRSLPSCIGAAPRYPDIIAAEHRRARVAALRGVTASTG